MSARKVLPETEMPKLTAGGGDDGHLYACWYPLANQEAGA